MGFPMGFPWIDPTAMVWSKLRQLLPRTGPIQLWSVASNAERLASLDRKSSDGRTPGGETQLATTPIYIINACIYIYGLVFRVPTPPNGMHPQVAPPSLLFASYWQHFWGPASYSSLALLGTCYLLDDLRSKHTPSKYLRATYSYMYMCYVSTSNIYI
jgi:hypothetical protein